MNAGRRLKFARKQAGLSVSQVAKMTGWDKEKVQEAENSTYANFEVLNTLPKLYGVSINWIVNGADAEGFILKNHQFLWDALMRSNRPDLLAGLMEITGLGDNPPEADLSALDTQERLF